MKKVIFWDFDGVIIDSDRVRIQGFKSVLQKFPESEVEKLLKFHNENGGLSRYVKFRFFFEEVLDQKVSEDQINAYASDFSEIMKNELIKTEYLIKKVVQFIENNFSFFDMHIVSGSDQTELRFLCEKLRLDAYFLSINGSPTPKITLVSDILTKQSYNKTNCILIGDSINDYDAAYNNNIDFFPFNNEKLMNLKTTNAWDEDLSGLM